MVNRLSLVVLLAASGASIGMTACLATVELSFPPKTAEEAFDDKRVVAVVGGLASGGIAGGAIADYLIRRRKKS